MKPDDYSSRTAARPPAPWYQRLNWLGVLLTSMGPAQRRAVTPQVRGRSSGKAGAQADADQARFDVGLEPEATPAVIAGVVDYYPVFRIDYDS